METNIEELKQLYSKLMLREAPKDYIQIRNKFKTAIKVFAQEHYKAHETPEAELFNIPNLDPNLRTDISNEMYRYKKSIGK